MDQLLQIGAESVRKALVRFCCGKKRIAMVTGAASYAACGAERFFANVLSEIESEALHVKVSGANPDVADVQQLVTKIDGSVDGFIAIGGGTVIDTTKLLNLAVVAGKSVRELLGLKEAPDKLKPCFAIPTTAGTGAEATRFAVCYDGKKKYSVDFLQMRPDEAGLVPEFSNTLPICQKLSTNFDAYAQAVESLWAKGATAESREYARKALDYIANEDWVLGAYWSGRAIDISRTTAAHAFSYYLTAQYGIPHGHAVYMVFEYICRNNGHSEMARKMSGLQTLREFATERHLEWKQLVDDLFANVNISRLGNNPTEVRKESFYE